MCVFRWPERYWKFSERPKLDSGVQAKPEEKEEETDACIYVATLRAAVYLEG